MVCSMGYEGPIFHKNGHTRGVYHLKIRGARGVPFMDNTPRDKDNIGKKMQAVSYLYSYLYLLFINRYQ